MGTVAVAPIRRDAKAQANKDGLATDRSLPVTRAVRVWCREGLCAASMDSCIGTGPPRNDGKVATLRACKGIETVAVVIGISHAGG